MAMMDPKAIGAHIRMLKPGLTALEHKVLDNIIAKPDFSEQTSLKEIAEENQVSEAMIVKIAKKLNFNGFREFRANLVLYRQLDISRLFSEISPDDNMEQLINKVFGNSVQALEETKVILNPHDLNHAADLLAHAGEILMFGMGGSAIIAEDLAHKFLRIGIRSQVLRDTHLMMMSATVCTEKSVVIAISHSGRTIDVIEALHLAKSYGAKTIVVTNYATSPITAYADITLSSTSQGSMFLGENAAARVAMLNILDVIFVAVTQRNLKRSEDFLIRTRAAVQEKRVK